MTLNIPIMALGLMFHSVTTEAKLVIVFVLWVVITKANNGAGRKDKKRKSRR